MVLLIDGTEADLYSQEDIPVTLTIEAAEVGTPGSAKGTRSNKILLPNTPTNRAIFGSSQPGSALKDRTKKRYEVSSGTGPIHTGTVLSAKATEENYEVYLIGDNAEWFVDLKDRLLTDLDLGRSKAHTVAHVNDSWVGSEVLLYSLMDRGFLFDEDVDLDCKLEWVLPNVRFRNILDRIVADLGYSPRYSPTFELHLNNLFAPFTSPIDRLQADKTTLNDHGMTAETTSPISTIGSGDPLDCDSVIYDPSAQYNAGPGNFIPEFDMRAWVTFRFTLSYTPPASWSIYFRLWNYTDSVAVAFAGTSLTTATPPSKTVIFEDVDLEVGKTYGIQLSTTSGSEPGVWVISYAHTTWTCKNIPFQENSRFEISSALPDMKQSDFVKGLLLLLCAQVDTDPHRHEITFTCFEDIVKQAEDAENWIAKVDYEDELPARIRDKEMPRVVRYRYKEDDADKLLVDFKSRYKGRGLGDADHQLTDENAVDEQEEKLPWAATWCGPSMGGIVMPRMLDKSQVGYGAAKYDWQPRILYYHGKRTEQWVLEGVTQTEFPDLCFVRTPSTIADPSLAFGEEGGQFGTDLGLIKRLHRSWLHRLEFSRQWDLITNLSDKDIHELDLKRTKVLRIGGTNLVVHATKIEQYKCGAEESTLVHYVDLPILSPEVIAKDKPIVYQRD